MVLYHRLALCTRRANSRETRLKRNSCVSTGPIRRTLEHPTVTALRRPSFQAKNYRGIANKDASGSVILSPLAAETGLKKDVSADPPVDNWLRM